MSDNNFNSDIDAILAEFASYSSSIGGPEPERKNRPAPEQSRREPPAEAEVPATVSVDEESEQPQDGYYVDVDMSMLTELLENRRGNKARAEKPQGIHDSPRPPKAAAAEQRAEKSAQRRWDAYDAAREEAERHRRMERQEEFSPNFKPAGREYRRPEPNPKKPPVPKKQPVAAKADELFSDKERERARKIRQQLEDKEAQQQAQRSALNQSHREQSEQRERVTEQRARADRPIMKVIAVLFALISLLAFAWVGVNVHPDSGTGSAAKVLTKLDLPHNLDVYLNNAYADALSGVTYIKKIYTIPESATVAPAPNPAAFGETTDLDLVEAVIADAAELLDGQKTLWSRDIQFYPGTTIQYYRDDSILVLAWKEVYDERCCTMAEVKVAHGSQFRRRLAEDSYSSSVQFYASEMAKASNAVVASNADFYAFRTMGVTVYQRQLFRAQPDRLDTCFITSSGDMLFTRAGELTDAGQINRYVQENDVLFSLSFGPVLVDNGELQYCPAYPIGEIDTQYSRAGIGMLGELHYLLMTVNHTDGRPRANVNQFGQYMYEKGCIKAYNLDGGQTSEIVMNGNPVNYIDFGAERTVSDIIYFASAIPETEWRSSAQTEVTQ